MEFRLSNSSAVPIHRVPPAKTDRSSQAPLRFKPTPHGVGFFASAAGCYEVGTGFRPHAGQVPPMATIHIEDRGDFVFFRWEGILKEAEILAVAAEYYPKLLNRHKLFDMTRADLTNLCPGNLAAIAQEVNTSQPQTGFPKTAFVASDIASYSLLSRYALTAFQYHVHIEYRVFGDIEQALEWLTAK